jgi:enoyl-CoA hydratase/carnithine racemase
VSGGYTTIEVRHDEGIAWITLARPQAGNAVDAAACGELCDALDAAGNDDAVRVVALSGQGAAFSVAGDLATTLRVGAPSPYQAADGAVLLSVMRDLPRPIVAVVQGECHSAGLTLLAAADLAMASTKARFWVPELKGGMWPAVPLAALGRALGARKALELALLGEAFDARAALSLGLVQRLVDPDQLEIESFVLLRAVAQRNPTALRLGLPAFRAGRDDDLVGAVARARAALDGILASADAREAVAAYQGQRPPQWRNR